MIDKRSRGTARRRNTDERANVQTGNHENVIRGGFLKCRNVSVSTKLRSPSSIARRTAARSG